MTENKKILICLYYYYPYLSWVTILVKNLAEWLAKKWYDVTVYCSRHDSKLKANDEVNGVKIIREFVLFPLWKWVVMPFFWFKAAILSRKYDRVNFHFPSADLWLSALFIPRGKLYVNYHCDLYLWKWFLNTFIQFVSFFLMNLWMKRAKKIVCTSLAYFNNCKFKKYIDTLEVIYPWVNYWNLAVSLEKIALDKSKYEGFFKVWFVGRIVYEKWVDYLLKSLEYLQDFPIYLFIAGDYEEVRWWSVYAVLKPLIDRFGDRVIFLWKIMPGQLKDFYQFIDLLVLPSIDPLEAFWMVQLESIYFWTPVLASDMPWISEVIYATKYGLLVKPRDSKDIADKIIAIYNSYSQYKHLKETWYWKKLIEEHFGFDTSIEKYETLFFGK